MPTAVFVGEGSAIDYTPGSAVGAGDVVVLGDLVGVAKTPIAANMPGALAVSGLFDVPKATGTGSAIAAGVNVFWDAAEKVAKTDCESGANKRLGKTVKAATDNDATVRVRLGDGAQGDLPALPGADGTYQLVVTEGEGAWEAVAESSSSAPSSSASESSSSASSSSS